MTVEEVRERLKELEVESLWLFGSVARGEGRPDRDLDVIVRYELESTFETHFSVVFVLQDEFGVAVDLAEPETLHPRLKNRILEKAIRVA